MEQKYLMLLEEQPLEKDYTKKTLLFCDIFSGCGGLSLGLTNAGWQGVFAIEKHPDAFATLQQNLITSNTPKFTWPEWLPFQAIDIVDLLEKYPSQLAGLNGQLDLLAGGPPCQGFSIAGRRKRKDPRNSLTEEYLKLVKILSPRMLLIENVQGFTMPFKKHGNSKSKNKSYSSQISNKLQKLGYNTFHRILDLRYFGLPQRRRRFILIAIQRNDPINEKLKEKSPFDYLEEKRIQFLADRNIRNDRFVSVKEAIGDLEVSQKNRIACLDSPVKGFDQIHYQSKSYSSPYIELMRQGVTDAPDSLRLPRHRPATIKRFKKILDTCELGRSITPEDRKRLGIKKRSITPLHQDKPSSTVTTLPDDILHYSEPRILTVRENARLQSFPDWYRFAGNYTTGGARRKSDCPRYTQVGNAVPPLFAEAVGLTLKDLLLS